LPRSDLQRVRYRLEDGELLREVWWVLDRAPDSEPVEQPLLEGLDEFSLRFLDQTDEWRESWPPTGAGVSGPTGLPRAVEISLDAEGVGELVWLVRLADSPAFALRSLGGPAPGDVLQDVH
jgi:general secretion pathway protein J